MRNDIQISSKKDINIIYHAKNVINLSIDCILAYIYKPSYFYLPYFYLARLLRSLRE